MSGFTKNLDPLPMTVEHLKKILEGQIDGRPVVFTIPGFGDVPVTGAMLQKGTAALRLLTANHGDNRLTVYTEDGEVH